MGKGASFRTRADLREDLERLGVGLGDTVMAHAALSKVGPMLNGPDALIGALLDAVGKDARHGRGHGRRCGRPADHRPAALARLHTGCRLMFVTDDDLVRDIAYTLADGSKSPSNTLFQGSN